jgi:hypothetical protein
VPALRGRPTRSAGAFCESCGKALPAAVQAGPRVVAGDAVATTAAGQQLQADQLHKQSKRARGALLAVAIIMTVVGALFFLILSQSSNAGANNPLAGMNQGAAVILLILAAVFWGLYIWSRSQPLPAAIVGLAIYGTLIVFNVITHVSQMGQEGAPRGIGVGCIDIIIIGVLAQAISAGVQHRKLMRQQQAQRLF